MAQKPNPLASPYKISPNQAKEALLRVEGLVLETSFLTHLDTPDNLARQGCIHTDSRAIEAQDIFVAYRGERLDSHAFLGTLIQKKPGLIVIEDGAYISLLESTKNPWILVSSGRKAWAFLWAEATGNPQNKLQFFGVTGTSGKSTTMWLMRELLRTQGVEALALGTFGYFLGDEKLPSPHTTPDPPEFFPLLRKAVDRNIHAVVMEVSSHSLAQFKLDPIKFRSLGWTNFSRDHLDFHQTMEEYFNAKLRFFSELAAPNARFVINKRLNPNFPAALTKHHETIFVDVTTRQTREAQTHLSFSYQKSSLEGVIPFLGDYNAENFVTAMLLVEPILTKAVNPKDWMQLTQVPGRLERVDPMTQKQPKVFVDYAHKPDALKSLLEALRNSCTGPIHLVFGCGGDRDAGKRPIMGKIAQELADRVYLTSDNPRSEEPNQIIQDILGGMLLPKEPQIMVEVDRKKAIFMALSKANPEDTVVIAGKGHENMQIFREHTHHFSDQEVAREFFKTHDSV